MNDMVDAAICALGEYYRHAGINEINLGNLLKHFRTEYSVMDNEKFNQDDGSRKIIEACMTQLILAPMQSEDKQIVDLGKHNAQDSIKLPIKKCSVCGSRLFVHGLCLACSKVIRIDNRSEEERLRQSQEFVEKLCNFPRLPTKSALH